MPAEVWEKHPRLYHYTTLDGLAGIIRTQQLWARFYRDLNDTTEFMRARGKLRELLIPAFKKYLKKNRSGLKPLIREAGGFAALASHEVDILLDASFDSAFGAEASTPMFPPFVASFCSHVDDKTGYAQENGLLSMWRGYGSNGGVAIVFNTKLLNACVRKEFEERAHTFLALGDVVYESDLKSFDEEFLPFIELFLPTAIEMIAKGRFDFDDKYMTGFFDLAARYKHRAFAEEREVRIIALPMTEEQFGYMGPKYTKRQSETVTRRDSRYIDLFGNRTAGDLPIEKVIIGPHLDQAAIGKTVTEILAGRDGIDIAFSATPYLPAKRAPCEGR